MTSHGVIRLRLLGNPVIEGHALDAPAVLKQPKRLLLLAYLAAREDFVTRDTLLGLFWPALDEDRARRALSQALHFLRSALGRGSLVTRGSGEVATGPGLLCDVGEFVRAVREERWERALELYQGELLSGVIPPRAREFGSWLESERLKLRRQATAAAVTLSSAAYEAGEAGQAIAWLRRGLEISPFDEALHREHLALLHDSGDPAGALAAHEMFRSRLRERYDIEPSPDTLRVVTLIRSRNSIPEASVPDRDAVGSAGHATVPGTKPGEPGAATRFPRTAAPERKLRVHRKPGPFRRRLEIGALAAVLVLVVATVALLDGRPTAGDNSLPLVQNRVAVLYLGVNGEDEQLRHLADGLTEALIGYLGLARSLDVVSANGVRPFRGQLVPPDTIRARLRAATIVDGVVSRSKRGVTRVTIDMINASTGSLRRQITVESTGGDALDIIDEVSARVGEELSPLLGDVVTLGRWQAGTGSALALDYVFEASTLQKNADMYTDLGNESAFRDALRTAEARLEAAARLDPDWIVPIIMRGEVALGMAWYCIYHLACEDEILPLLDHAAEHADEALAINSLDAAALELKGRARLESWQLDSAPDMGHLQEAHRLLSAATLLDPSRAGAWAALSSVHFAESDFERAEDAARRALDEDAFLDDRTEIQMRLFMSAFHRGHDLEAESWCDAVRAWQRTGNWMGAECTLNLLAWSPRHEPDVRQARLELDRGLGHDVSENGAVIRPRLQMLLAAVLARAGRSDEAQAEIDKAEAAAHPDDPDIYYYAAGAYAALGDRERAATYLQKFLGDTPANRRHIASYRWFEGILADAGTPFARAPG